MITNWHFYLLAFPAVVLLGAAKGGFSGISVLSLPLMTLVVSPLQAAAITLPILMVQDIISLWAYRKNMHQENLRTLLPGAFVGIICAALLVNVISDQLIKLMVGVIATGFVLNRWRGTRTTEDEVQSPSYWRGTFWGYCAGFTSFLTNSGGPPVQIYLLPQKLAPPRLCRNIRRAFCDRQLHKIHGVCEHGADQHRQSHAISNAFTTRDCFNFSRYLACRTH
jgi:uncharacterized protein